VTFDLVVVVLLFFVVVSPKLTFKSGSSPKVNSFKFKSFSPILSPVTLILQFEVEILPLASITFKLMV